MRALVEAVLFTLGLIAACAGVGGAILRWGQLEEPGERGPARPLSVGVSAAFGFAVLLAFGGLGMVLRIPVALTLAVFSGVGIVLLGARLVRNHPRWAGAWIAVLGFEAVAFGLVLLTQAGVGIAFNLNVCDDVLAYLPEARRLLVTHTLLEPWSTRRLQNFGGQTFLQAAYIQFLGKSALGLTETLLPVGLLWLLLSTALRRPFARLLSFVPLVFLPFFDVPRANTAGTLSVVPFLVTLGVLVLVARRAAQQGNRRGTLVSAAALGVTAAAAVSIRTNVALAAALIAVVAAGTTAGTARDRARTVSICVVAGIVSFVPWSIAMWESSSTPLYPILRGNENPHVPSVGGTSAFDLGDFFHTERQFLTNSIYPVALIVLLVIVLVAWKAFPTSAPIAALMAGAAFANMVVLATSVAIAANSDFDRYTFPVVGGVLFFLVRAAFVRLDEEGSLARRPALAPAFLTLAAVAAFFWVGTRNAPDAIVKVSSINAARVFVENAADIQDLDAQVTPDTSVAEARAALAAIPPGAKTILAVSEPDAFLTTGADVQSMDQPGSAAPKGSFPFFSGPKAKVRALRSDGYDFLVVSPGSNNRCFQHDRIQAFLHSPVLAYRVLSPYVLDFFDDMDAVAQRYPQATKMINGFYVIDLRAVPGTVPGRVDVRRP